MVALRFIWSLAKYLITSIALVGSLLVAVFLIDRAFFGGWQPYTTLANQVGNYVRLAIYAGLVFWLPLHQRTRVVVAEFRALRNGNMVSDRAGVVFMVYAVVLTVWVISRYW